MTLKKKREIPLRKYLKKALYLCIGLIVGTLFIWFVLFWWCVSSFKVSFYFRDSFEDKKKEWREKRLNYMERKREQSRNQPDSSKSMKGKTTISLLFFILVLLIFFPLNLLLCQAKLKIKIHSLFIW